MPKNADAPVPLMGSVVPGDDPGRFYGFYVVRSSKSLVPSLVSRGTGLLIFMAFVVHVNSLVRKALFSS